MPTHSFTGEKVSFTYPRVLQIAGGIIYDGVGETVSISDINIFNPFTGSITGPQGNDGPQGYQGVLGPTGPVGGFTIIYNTGFNVLGFTSSVIGTSDPDFSTAGDLYLSYFDKNNVDLTTFYTELRNAMLASSPSAAQYFFLKIFSTTDSTQLGIYRIPISAFQIYSEGVYIYHTDLSLLVNNIATPSEIGLSFLLNAGDQGVQGDAGNMGPVGGLSIGYVVQYNDTPSSVAGFRENYIGYSRSFSDGAFGAIGTLWLSKIELNNIDYSSFYTALKESIDSSSPSGNQYIYIKLFVDNTKSSIFKCLISDITDSIDGLQFDNFTFVGGNLYYEGVVYISFLLNSGDIGIAGAQGATGPSGTEESKLTSLVASGTPIIISSGMSASFLWQNVYDVGSGWTYSYVKEGYSDRYFAIGNGFNDSVYCIKQQLDGKIWVGGNFDIYNDISLNDWSGGNLDSRKLILLDDQGRCLVNFTDGFNGLIKDIEINSEGYILIGGSFTTFNSNIANYFIGLNSDGTLYSYFDGFDNDVNVIKVQPDGKVLVGGSFTIYGTYSCNRLIRFNDDMTVDYDFYINMSIGAGSESEAAFNEKVNDISFQSDGSIIISGNFTSFSSVYAGRIVKLNSDGTINSDFYNTVGGNNSDNAYDSELFKAQSQSDNKIVVLTENKAKFIGVSVPTYFSRLNTDGSLDTTFNYDSGTGIDTLSDIGNDLIILPDDSIIIGGLFNKFSTILYGSIDVNYIAKTDRDGNLDQEFNQALLYGGFNSYVRTLYLQNDGKILVGGKFTSFVDGYSTTNSSKLIRLQSSTDGIYIPETADYVIQYQIVYKTNTYSFSGPFATIMKNDRPINSTNKSLPIISNLSRDSSISTGLLTDFKILSLSKDDKISINIFNLDDDDFTNSAFTVIDSGIKIYDGLSNFSSLSIYKAKNGSNGLITGTGAGNGYQGYRGLQGYQGFDGPQGPVGDTGPQGFQGINGGFGLTFSGALNQLAYFNSTTGLTSSNRLKTNAAGTVLQVGTGSTGVLLRDDGGTYTALFNGSVSPSTSNYFLKNNGSTTLVNASTGGALFLAFNGTGIVNVGANAVQYTRPIILAAGTTTIQPIRFQSGTNLTTAVNGSMEYNGTNLFFTRTGAVRETVLMGNTASAPTTSIGAGVVNYYGGSATNFLGDPVGWISVVDNAGTTRKIPFY